MGERLPVLDGWRATSILLVLACHLLPLGHFGLNETAGAAGMALFFTLSGFLIVSFLANGMAVGDFLIRRTARILPLAWVAISVLVVWRLPGTTTALRNYMFTANLPPAALMNGGQHLWSLCVEMQFYALAAAICLAFGRRGLWLVPALCILVTVARVEAHQYVSIVTWHRIDEILAGGSLALLRNRVPKIPLWLLLIALLVCSHPHSGAFQYFRPYAAALLVGASLRQPPTILLTRPMAYIADISYALYVVHGVLMTTWLGAGGTKLATYLKRPLLFAATFLIAHCSTRYFERPIIKAAKRLAKGNRKAELAANEARA